MKNKILIATAFLFTTIGTFAQHKVGSWNIQPKIGLNISTMTNSDGEDARVGFAGGAEVEYQAIDILSITAGVLYSQQGLKANVAPINSKIKMDYINIPILANVYVLPGFAVKLGLQPGILVNDKVKVTYRGTSVETGIEEALRNAGMNASVKSFDLAIPIGLSYEYKNVQLDARYNYSLTNAITARGENTKNSVLQITLGYKFNL